MSVSAFPLQWPEGRARKPVGLRKRAKFSKKEHNGRWLETKSLTVSDALGRLQDELDMLGARYPVVSTNLETRLDGLPRSGQREPDDPGVALYFDLAGKPHCMPCDTYDRAADNIASIAKHIEATRAIDRFGVATVNEMFAGFAALPAPGETKKRRWRDVFEVGMHKGVHDPVNRDFIDRRYRELAKKAHPDTGGSKDAFAELQNAREEALREVSR